MTYPVFTNVRNSTTASVEVCAEVSSAPELYYRGGSLMPDRITALYTFEPGASRWIYAVTVFGYRMLMNGTVGRARKQETYWYTEGVAPQWVCDFVRANEPATLPHIPQVIA